MNRLIASLLCACALLPFALGQNLTLLPDAVSKGAVCLDGTPPGFYWRPGTGKGVNSWIVFQQGGGWCYDEDSCVQRSKTRLGSSKYFPKMMVFSGLLSADCEINPDFCDWNVAYLPYCDGASFSGDKTEPLNWKGTTLYFRGKRILDAVFDHLLAGPMGKAERVILSGCSAGGLATYLHADYAASRTPEGATFHAIADAGYFIDALNAEGQQHIRPLYQYVYHMQNCSGGVNQHCIAATAEVDRWQCFMAQYTLPHIQSKFFALNSEYDTWQLSNILQLGCTPPKCSAQQMVAFNKWRGTFLAALSPAVNVTTRGLFTDACLVHCQGESDTIWNSYKVGEQSIRETFGNWYFDRTTGKGREIDCAYPCNPTCTHHLSYKDDFPVFDNID